MHVTAKADYAVRAVVELPTAPGLAAQGRRSRAGAGHPGVVPGEHPHAAALERDRAQPARARGWLLARAPAEEVNLADIIRAVEGPLVGVRGQRPEEVEYVGSAEALQPVWIALRANLREVLESVTVADVAAGKLPKEVLALTREEEAWHTRCSGWPRRERSRLTRRDAIRAHERGDGRSPRGVPCERAGAPQAITVSGPSQAQPHPKGGSADVSTAERRPSASSRDGRGGRRGDCERGQAGRHVLARAEPGSEGHPRLGARLRRRCDPPGGARVG